MPQREGGVNNQSMKKILLLSAMAFLAFSSKAQAQSIMQFGQSTLLSSMLGDSGIDLGDAYIQFGIDGYTTNYLTSTILGLPFAYSIHVDRGVPDDFAPGRMKSPWRRTFSHPFKRFGDLAAGVAASLDFEEFPIGVYAALKYKTTEVAYNNLPKGDDNDRAHYINPELGLRAHFGDMENNAFAIELGASYDAAFKYSGHVNDYGKKAINSGFNLVGGIGYTIESGSLLLKYTHPLYNFYNEDFSPDGGLTQPLKGFKYKIGFISLILRHTL